MIHQYILVLGVLVIYTLVSIHLQRKLNWDNVYSAIMTVAYIIICFKGGIVD